MTNTVVLARVIQSRYTKIKPTGSVYPVFKMRKLKRVDPPVKSEDEGAEETAAETINAEGAE